MQREISGNVDEEGAGGRGGPTFGGTGCGGGKNLKPSSLGTNSSRASRCGFRVSPNGIQAAEKPV